MQKFVRTVKDFALPAIALLFPVAALAQGVFSTPPTGSAPTSNLNSTTALEQTICGAINWIFYIIIVVAVIMVLVAAFKYLTAGGDPEKVKSASHILLYVAVAIIVALIAKAFPTLIASFINGGTGNTGC